MVPDVVRKFSKEKLTGREIRDLRMGKIEKKLEKTQDSSANNLSETEEHAPINYPQKNLPAEQHFKTAHNRTNADFHSSRAPMKRSCKIFPEWT